MLALLITLIAGCLLALAFAPFNLFLLAFISPAVLLYFWLNSTPWQAFWRGLAFGIGLYGIGTSWVFISIHTFGNASLPLALLITALFTLVLALFPATQGYVLMRLFGKKNPAVTCLLAFPASWVLWEWLRELPLNGFPWLYLGYSQFSTPLHYLAPWLGVYGVSLAVALISGALVAFSTLKSRKAITSSALIIIVLISGSWLLHSIKWAKTVPAGDPIKVSLIQGNIAQPLKWNPDHTRKILSTYARLNQHTKGSRIVIWPEASVPAFPQQIPNFLFNIDQEAKQNKQYLIFGVPTYNENKDEYFNSLMMLGEGQGLYQKKHLVPFGEYVPMYNFFNWLMGSLQIPMSNFTPGLKNQSPLPLGRLKVAPFICYEIAFSQEVLHAAKETQLLINISDDSWFDGSIALWQQMQMARLRALEVGRPMLLATNTGITGFINAQGELYASLPLNQEKILTNTVTPMKGQTPLMRWHYYPLWTLVLLLFIIAFFYRKTK